MKKFKFTLCVLLMLSLVTMPLNVSADMGPKPSVVVEFEGLEGEEYYVTLLSEEKSTGPWSYGNPYYDYMGDEAVFQKFSEYVDKDGYYFLSFMENCSDDSTFEWTYYPPTPFKVLVYFPEYDSYLTDDTIYERYAFDSYFTVEVSNEEKFEVVDTAQSYDFSMELVSLVARIVLTIIVEILIAYIFALRDKKSLKIITATNIVTQIVLNILLNVINYRSGQYAFVFHYIWMECAICVIEAAIYQKTIMRDGLNMKYRLLWYSVVANVVSFMVGMWIAKIVPGIF